MKNNNSQNGDKTMKSKLTKFAQMAALGLALTFTKSQQGGSI
jgi:hypothetical protein